MKRKLIQLIKSKIKRHKNLEKIIISFIESITFLENYSNLIFQYFKFKRKNDERFSIQWRDRQLMLNDNTNKTSFSRHYVYFNAWALRKIKKINPKKHIDISSSLYFCTSLSAFIKTEFYDYRPASIKLSNLKSKKGDLLDLPFKDESVKSLSCMHVIEHIGLGRYGDKINPRGDILAANELTRILAKKGDFLLVAPIGKPLIKFNAHRIYDYNQIINLFGKLKLKEFSLIESKTNNGIIENASQSLINEYDCGCFWFTK